MARRPARTVDDLAARWSLTLRPPFQPGGECAWVAPAVDARGRDLVLKVGWRHPEAEPPRAALREFDAWRPAAGRRGPPGAAWPA